MIFTPNLKELINCSTDSYFINKKIIQNYLNIMMLTLLK